ncbi:MAG: hypothetical protein FJ261_04945 [Planctomycetes bacterium]|nr:hypothetical protein [Planctomycetota bacterium]
MNPIITLACASILAGQDLSLATILIDGQGWKPAPMARVDSTLGPDLVAKGPANATYAIVGKAPARALEYRPASGPARPVTVVGLVDPSCLGLSPDKGTLVVGDAGGKHLWLFRVNADGTLDAADRCATMRLKPGQKASGVIAVSFDPGGRIFACSPNEIHAFDPTARESGVIAGPPGGGVDAFFTNGEGLYARRKGEVWGRMIQPFPKPALKVPANPAPQPKK